MHNLPTEKMRDVGEKFVFMHQMVKIPMIMHVVAATGLQQLFLIAVKDAEAILLAGRFQEEWALVLAYFFVGAFLLD